MKLRHFEALKPVCPVCRETTPEGRGVGLRVGKVEKEAEGEVLEGALHCGNPACLREYPIFDGVPLLIAGLRDYVSDNLFHLNSRDDLGELLESMVGDCSGPGSWFDVTRQHLSSYAWDHYAEFDPLEPAEPDLRLKPGGLKRIYDVCGHSAGPPTPGPVLDAGCSVGGLSLHIAGQTDELVLGVDLNFSMLRLAVKAVREGRISYPRRRVGVVFDRRTFDVPRAGAEQVDVWACDASQSPFAPGTFGTVAAMNVVDSVKSPIDFLHALPRLLKPGGHLLLAAPYDWAKAVTPMEAWLGGHSQRGAHQGASDVLVRGVFTPGVFPFSVPDVRIAAEHDRLPWRVRMHDRASMLYDVHALAVEKLAPANPAGGGP